jgi:glutathione S-transferase
MRGQAAAKESLVSDLILHHYAMSPYSAKVRAMLGCTGLDWQSVVTKEMPPRPLVEALAGGYRRIPVAQSGADVFCDSHVIAAEIAERARRPELAPEGMGEAERAWVAHAEGEVFFACILAAPVTGLWRNARATVSVGDLLRVTLDRLSMGLRISRALPGPIRSRKVVADHVDRVERQLQRDFLFGDAPRIGDFATYHSLWFVRDLGGKPFPGHPRTMAWMDRIKAFGEGGRREISAETALEIARAATPRPISNEHTQHVSLKKPVRVAPSDYWQVPTTGELVGSTPSRWILRREDPRAGVVHVHFPKEGYTLQEV